MDKKALQILKEYNQLFIDRNFIEKDVLGFFIFIREYLPDSGVLKELSHFIAHRNRDKGTTYSFTKKIDDALNATPKTVDDVLKNEQVIYLPQTIQHELDAFFKSFGLPTLNPVTINEIIMCLMSLLQAIPILEKKLGTKICELELCIYKDKAVLYATFNYAVNASSAVPFLIPIMVVKYISRDFLGETECISNPATFSTIRVNGKLEFK